MIDDVPFGQGVGRAAEDRNSPQAAKESDEAAPVDSEGDRAVNPVPAIHGSGEQRQAIVAIAAPREQRSHRVHGPRRDVLGPFEAEHATAQVGRHLSIADDDMDMIQPLDMTVTPNERSPNRGGSNKQIVPPYPTVRQASEVLRNRSIKTDRVSKPIPGASGRGGSPIHHCRTRGKPADRLKAVRVARAAAEAQASRDLQAEQMPTVGREIEPRPAMHFEKGDDAPVFRQAVAVDGVEGQHVVP